MKTTIDLAGEIMAIIKNSPLRDKIKSVAFFGSHAIGEQTEESDVDLLVDLTEPVGFPFIRLAEELSEKLGKKVDLLTPESISPYLRDKIMKTKKIIYER